ncbi:MULTISPECIES: putative sugar nucleotidyl transferase [unclassified Siphonobacter]|nr:MULTISPECIES: putative sugar nucleotidyl transferase [unclassified Siphonobacter]MDQ1087383.1 UDP-N-acetylglucosamine diphosphorylase/glucosamine-1-phosphate N-acetyltransferase [Siphonobacter sp. SORGH_AS_1065]MDR6193537.1 UDP-N-acetylglucosamine diphosphorylase/glucosamine-1-phosphate N-acetyltransferase [Siphonobacter sp. SORGH_AS_0500]
MINYVLFDGPEVRPHLLPLVFTRPMAELRIGIRTITEKWTDWLGVQPTHYTQSYLQEKYPYKKGSDTIYIHGGLCPSERLIRSLEELEPGEALLQGPILLAVRGKHLPLESLIHDNPAFHKQYYWDKVTVVQRLPDLVAYNGEQIAADFERITEGRTSQPITDRFTAYYNESKIFIEEGVELRSAILNAENGPIYLGKDVQVQDGVIIQGPFAALEGAVINLGGKMRKSTTIGPHCKVGGEISMSILMGYSNKGHDGFLGNSYLAEWCNLGANTNNSNLKNDYGNVKLYDYTTKQLEDTGRQFVGLFMGDYSKAGISTMFNTGTVVGVNVNVFGAGFPPKHIPSFSWGGADTGFEPYRFTKAVDVARNTMDRRGKLFTEIEEDIWRTIFALEQTVSIHYTDDDESDR